MEDKKLIERLEFKGPEMHLDGSVIFRTPETHFSTRDINVIGVDEERGKIDIGTGSCCHGYFMRLERDEVQKEKFTLDYLTPIDFNVYDLLPVQLERPKDISNKLSYPPSEILTTGYGCCGSGVRMLSLHSPLVHKEIISEKEFDEMSERNKGLTNVPTFRVEKNRIYLDMLLGYYSSAPNRQEQEFRIAETNRSIDLTDRLRVISVDYRRGPARVDIEKTIDLATKYQIKKKK